MKEELDYQLITFRYLAEFREWLYKNADKEIIDIDTTGEWNQMEIVVKYQREDVE